MNVLSTGALLSRLNDNFFPIFFMASELVHGMFRTSHNLFVAIDKVHRSRVTRSWFNYRSINCTTTDHPCEGPVAHARFSRSSRKVVLATYTRVRDPLRTNPLSSRCPGTSFSAARAKPLDFQVVPVPSTSLLLP